MSLNSHDLDRVARIVSAHYKAKTAKAVRNGREGAEHLAAERRRITAWLEDCAKAARCGEGRDD